MSCTNTKHLTFHVGKTEVRPKILWDVRLPWGLQTQLLCSKDTSNPGMWSNMGLFEPSYGDKWLPKPAGSHQSAQNHENLIIVITIIIITISLTIIITIIRITSITIIV